MIVALIVLSAICITSVVYSWAGFVQREFGAGKKGFFIFTAGIVLTWALMYSSLK